MVGLDSGLKDYLPLMAYVGLTFAVFIGFLLWNGYHRRINRRSTLKDYQRRYRRRRPSV